MNEWQPVDERRENNRAYTLSAGLKYSKVDNIDDLW